MPPLLEHSRFPGNIREFEAMIRRAILCSQGPVLTSLDFYPENIEKESPQDTVRIQFKLGRQSFQEIQGLVIHEVLRLAKHDVEQAAQFLHISPQMPEEHLQRFQDHAKNH